MYCIFFYYHGYETIQDNCNALCWPARTNFFTTFHFDSPSCGVVSGKSIIESIAVPLLCSKGGIWERVKGNNSDEYLAYKCRLERSVRAFKFRVLGFAVGFLAALGEESPLTFGGCTTWSVWAGLRSFCSVGWVQHLAGLTNGSLCWGQSCSRNIYSRTDLFGNPRFGWF